MALTLTPLPPEEALRFFRSKGYAPPDQRFSWQDMEAQEHAVAFQVAKATQLDILQDIRDAVDKALAEGRTLEQFRAELAPLLRSKGWWGRQRMVDPLTGEERVVQLGSPHRLRTIFDTNLRSAYSAGRWERMQRTKAVRPWLRYVAVLDDRTRPLHRQWHGTVLAVDDPWWRTHWPPNGWYCRCQVVSLSDRDLRRYGYRPSPAAPASDTIPWTNRRTGEVQEVPRGVDPGFAQNVGEARGSAVAQALRQKLEGLDPSLRPAMEREIARGPEGRGGAGAPPPPEPPPEPTPEPPSNEVRAEEARAWVLEQGRQTTTEYLYAWDLDSGELLQQSGDGQRSAVSFNDGLLAALKDPQRRIEAHHNHPSSSCLSEQDLRVFGLPGLDRLSAHGHTGSLFSAARGEAFDAARYLRQVTAVRQSLEPVLQVLMRRGALDPAEAVRLRAWLMLRVLDRGRILQAELRDDLQEREIAARLGERGIENLIDRTLADMRRLAP